MGLIRTDGAVVQLSANGALTTIPLLIRNESTDTLFVGRCDAEVDLILEHKTATGWQPVSANYCSYVEVPSIPISMGAQRIQVRVSLPGDEQAGMPYRVVVAVYSGRASRRESLIPLALRTSNTFTIERRD